MIDNVIECHSAIREACPSCHAEPLAPCITPDGGTYPRHIHVARSPVRPDLKRVFMEVGNKLVTEHGFQPAISTSSGGPLNRSTATLRAITVFFNSHPEAREALAQMGFKWSV